MATALEQPKKTVGGAFGRFLSEQRPALAKECAGKPVTAVLKLASERFKLLGEAERAEWEKKYKEAQAQYDKDMDAFLAAGGEKKAKKAVKRKGHSDDKKVKKQKKDPDAPKRPAGGAYACYLAAHREAFTKECASAPGNPMTAVARLAGERWGQLSPEARKPYEAEYEVKKAAYEAAMKSYTPPETAVVEEPREETTRSSKEPTERARKGLGKAKSETPPKVAGVRKAKKVATSGPSQPVLEASVAAQADQAGLTATLLKLVTQQDVMKSGKSQAEALSALVTSDGLLHPARRALLGA